MASCDRSTFVDIKCGVGEQAGNTYAVTSEGVLCCFDDSRVMEMWVEVCFCAGFHVPVFRVHVAGVLLVVKCLRGCAIHCTLPASSTAA